MFKFFSIYSTFFKQQIKSLIEYKFDFAMGMIGLTVFQIGSFILLLTVFTNVKAIGSYSFDEILLFYGYSQIVRGIDHLYNDNMWSIAWGAIRDGRFSLFLIRPLSPIMHIVMERVQLDAIGELLIGIIIFGYAKGNLNLVFGLTGWAVFAVFLISGLAIYFAVKLICVAVSFWTVSSGEFMTITYEINSFTKYPLDIYKNNAMQILLTYILPFAVVSYFPMLYYIRDNSLMKGVFGIQHLSNNALVLFVLAVSVVSLLVSLIIWKLGLRRYEPTGT